MNFAESQIKLFLQSGYALLGSNGGLLLGNSHAAGGIPVLWKTSNGYILTAEFEGYEYLLNPGATAYYQNTFLEINKHSEDKTEDFTEYDIPQNALILDCRATPELQNFGWTSKLLILEGPGHSICNKYSTKLHLEKLINMNRGILHEYNHEDPLKATQLSIKRADTGMIIEQYPIIHKIENSSNSPTKLK